MQDRVFFSIVGSLFYPIPKNLSKNAIIFSITFCFFSDLFPLPKRDIAGRMASISVPDVLTGKSYAN